MSRPRPQVFLLTVLVLFALSAGVNILQAQRIHSLLDFQSTPPSTIGKRITAITGFSSSGESRQLDLRATVPTVVYYFSPTCGWCERNWPNVKALAAGADGRYRVLLLSSARDTRAYLNARELGQFDVIEGIDEGTRRAFGFAATPHTIVVSNGGLVTHDWRGAFTPRVERQLEELFAIDLPGLLPTKK